MALIKKKSSMYMYFIEFNSNKDKIMKNEDSRIFQIQY